MGFENNWLLGDAPPLLVAELSGNHGGSLNKAFELVEKAVESGADAIKLQTYSPETITVKGRCDRFLLKDGLWAGQYLDQLYAKAMTPWEWHEPLAQRASDLDVMLFSSPFDESSVKFLEDTLAPHFGSSGRWMSSNHPSSLRERISGKSRGVQSAKNQLVA